MSTTSPVPVAVSLLAALCASCATTANPLANRSLEAPSPGLLPAQDAGPDEDAEEPPNRVGLFLGGTHKNGSDAFSTGLEYERRLSELIGLGLELEFTPAISERLIAARAVFVHPVGELAADSWSKP